MFDLRPRRRVRLRNCPPGLFLFDLYGSPMIGFKSEYADNTPGHGGDAYCLETGEYFWGGTRDHQCRAALMVTPLVLEGDVAAIGKAR